MRLLAGPDANTSASDPALPFQVASITSQTFAGLLLESRNWVNAGLKAQVMVPAEVVPAQELAAPFWKSDASVIVVFAALMSSVVFVAVPPTLIVAPGEVIVSPEPHAALDPLTKTQLVPVPV